MSRSLHVCANELTNTSYLILIKWHPSRLVGGNGGTYKLSLCHRSEPPDRILPRAITASSRFSTWTILLRAKYSMVSVSAAFVPFMVILLPFDTYADTDILSPGTKPPRSNVTLHLTRPPPTQVIPSRCSISHLKGCCGTVQTKIAINFGRKLKTRLFFGCQLVTYRQYRLLHIQINWIHYDEDLMILVN